MKYGVSLWVRRESEFMQVQTRLNSFGRFLFALLLLLYCLTASSQAGETRKIALLKIDGIT